MFMFKPNKIHVSVALYRCGLAVKNGWLYPWSLRRRLVVWYRAFPFWDLYFGSLTLLWHLVVLYKPNSFHKKRLKNVINMCEGPFSFLGLRALNWDDHAYLDNWLHAHRNKSVSSGSVFDGDKFRLPSRNTEIYRNLQLSLASLPARKTEIEPHLWVAKWRLNNFSRWEFFLFWRENEWNLVVTICIFSWRFLCLQKCFEYKIYT